MREIKFRGKRLWNIDGKKGEWAYGYFFEQTEEHFINPDIDGGTTLIDCTYIFQSGERIEVDPKTVGQYIGLIASDFDDLYEGDITEDADGTRCVIKYQEVDKNRTRGYSKGIGFVREVIGGLGETRVFEDGSPYDKIGNIHDNPELLEARGRK